MPNFMELAKESSMRNWSLQGPNRPVKVISPSISNFLRLQQQEKKTKHRMATGYITQEKYLFGKTCREIEAAIGLRPFELRSVCYVYSLFRLPRFDEIEFRLFCSFPDGGVIDSVYQENALAAREDWISGKNMFVRAQTPVVNFYPPGSSDIPQWKLTAPIPIGMQIATVTTTIPFQ